MVSELFQLLNSMRDQLGIQDWGLKMTTLEDGEGPIPRPHDMS